MANHAEILRYIDSIARDKEIDKEALIEGIEQAMSHALAKKYGVEDVDITLDRETGEFVCNYEVSMEEQGRIFAMSVKQAIISKVRESRRHRFRGRSVSGLSILSSSITRQYGTVACESLQSWPTCSIARGWPFIQSMSCGFSVAGRSAVTTSKAQADSASH